MQSTIPTAATSAQTNAPVRPRRRRAWFRIGEPISPRAYSTLAALSFLLPFALWCIATYGHRADGQPFISPLILPSPGAVVMAAKRLFSGGELWHDTWISVFRIMAGFGLSAALAIPLGILIGSYKGIEAAQEPLVGFIRYIPVPALLPLVMVVAGIDEAAKILLIFIGTYFQMVIIVADVTRQVPRDLLSAARTLGAKPSQLLFNVLLPATLPGLMETCRTMIGWAWTYLVIAEVVATTSGLGFRLVQARRYLRVDEMFVSILMLGLLGLANDMIFKWLQPRVLPWTEANRN